MMFRIIRLSFGDVFRPELRSLLLKSMGLAILFLFLIWLGVQWLAAQAITLPYAWLDLGLSILASVGLFLIAIYFVPAVTSLVAGFFLDDIAKHIERIHYGEVGVGKEMAVLPSLILAVQFTFLVIPCSL